MRRAPPRRAALKSFYTFVAACSFVLVVMLFVPTVYWNHPAITSSPTRAQLPDPVLQPEACRAYFTQLSGVHDSPSTAAFGQYVETLGLSLPSSTSCTSSALNRTHPDAMFIAANLHNSLHVLPHFALQVLRYAAAAPPGGVFVSIYESDSSDGTPQYLQALERLLAACAIPHQVTASGPLVRAAGEDRIAFLAKVRNAVLQPLVHGAFRAEHVAFINDVFFCAEDIERLAAHDADIACGMDFEPILADLPASGKRRAMSQHLSAHWHLPRPVSSALSRSTAAFKLWRRAYGRTPAALDTLPLLFYDTWVARDAAGRRVSRLSPYVSDPASRERLRAGLPVPVQCCWNGLAVLRAAPFSAGVRFRAHGAGECAASECSLLCDDFWRGGHRRFVMDPAVRVAYRALAARKLHGAAVRGLPAGPARPVAPPVPWEQLGVNVEGVVECCPILPGRNTVDFQNGCFMYSLAANASSDVATHALP
jgi:alpha-1,3-mannosyltransferase